MELCRIETCLCIFHSGHRANRCMRRHFEALRNCFNIVCVTHPHNCIAYHSASRCFRTAHAKLCKQTAAVINGNLGSAVFTYRRGCNSASQLVGKNLRTVANTQHRNSKLKKFRTALRRVLAVHTVGTARQNNSRRSQRL